MNVSKLLRGPESLRTGPQPPVGGRIYDVDPAAVARLKQLMAEKADDRPVRHTPVVVSLLRRQRQREKEIAMQNEQILSDADAAAVHVEVYQAGGSIEDAAQWAGVSAYVLRNRWKSLGAPVSRTVAERTWDGPAVVSREPAEKEAPAAVAATVAVNGRESVTREARELVIEPGKPAVPEQPAAPSAIAQLLTLLQQDGVEVSGRINLEIEISF